MPKGKILMGKKTPKPPVSRLKNPDRNKILASKAKPATKTPRRPQLDKMGPGEGTSKGKYTSTYSAYDPKVGAYTFSRTRNYTISGAKADERNAKAAYDYNPANIDKNKRKGRVTMTSGSVDRTSYVGDRNQTYKRSGGK